MLVDRLLPGQEFFNGQSVAGAGLFKAQKPPTYRRDDLGLATDDPSLGCTRRKIGNRQRAAVRPDNVLYPGTHIRGHCALLRNSTSQQCRESTLLGLKIG